MLIIVCKKSDTYNVTVNRTQRGCKCMFSTLTCPLYINSLQDIEP